MKSLRYILCGRPVRLADCLDLARSRRPISVSVHADSREVVGEFVTGRQFVARFIWQWPERTVCCEEVCGFDDGVAGQGAASLCKADRKLRERIAAVGALGVPVLGRQSRFGEEVSIV